MSYSVFTSSIMGANEGVYQGYLGRVLLFRMYSPRKRPRWVPEDYQSRIIKNGSVLPEKEFQKSLNSSPCNFQATSDRGLLE